MNTLVDPELIKVTRWLVNETVKFGADTIRASHTHSMFFKDEQVRANVADAPTESLLIVDARFKQHGVCVQRLLAFTFSRDEASAFVGLYQPLRAFVEGQINGNRGRSEYTAHVNKWLTIGLILNDREIKQCQVVIEHEKLGTATLLADGEGPLLELRNAMKAIFEGRFG